MEITKGLTFPFFLTWANEDKTAIFVAERDPANRITIVETVPGESSVRTISEGLGIRPSSVVCVNAGRLVVCCDKEIDKVTLDIGPMATGWFMGIGLVPWNLINDKGPQIGMADTTTQSKYPHQFPKNSPFGGLLSLKINHHLARDNKISFYRISVDGIPRLDSWWHLKLNTANGKYEIPVQFKPFDIDKAIYKIREPNEWLYDPTLGMELPSTQLADGLRTVKIEFLDSPSHVVQTQVLYVLIDNNQCVASIQMPSVGNNSATTECGMLKFKNIGDWVTIENDVASHPTLLAAYSWRLGRAGQGPLANPEGCSIDEDVSLASSSAVFKGQVGALLGKCPSAAFYAHVYVAAKAINGIGRQSQYDASATIAFALTP